MGIETAKTGKLLYHLTELEHLDSILENGLLSRKIITDNSIEFLDVADQEIMSKRIAIGLDEYIPFHFHPYSAFDVAVKNNFSQKDFMYICITRDLARENKFRVLPIHPLSAEDVVLYDFDEGLNKIDWNTMHTTGTTDSYSRNVKMAECLTKLIIPAKHIQCIYVKDEDTKIMVEEKLKNFSIDSPPPYVNVQAYWFL